MTLELWFLVISLVLVAGFAVFRVWYEERDR